MPTIPSSTSQKLPMISQSIILMITQSFMITHVHSWSLMITDDHWCSPMVTCSHSCSLKVTHIHWCSPVNTHGHWSRSPSHSPMVTNVHRLLVNILFNTFYWLCIFMCTMYTGACQKHNGIPVLNHATSGPYSGKFLEGGKILETYTLKLFQKLNFETKG